MKNKMYLCIVIIMFFCSSVFSQSNVASKLQLERIGKQANGIIQVVKFNGYINGGENLYFEFKNIQGYKGIGYITKSAEVINQYVIDETTGKLADVSRSEFVNNSEFYISASSICCDQVNEKFIFLDGKKGTLSASLDTNGNLTYEFITNDGKHIFEYIEDAIGPLLFSLN